jgi:hypothetical protein
VRSGARCAFAALFRVGQQLAGAALGAETDFAALPLGFAVVRLAGVDRQRLVADVLQFSTRCASAIARHIAS